MKFPDKQIMKNAITNARLNYKFLHKKLKVWNNLLKTKLKNLLIRYQIPKMNGQPGSKTLLLEKAHTTDKMNNYFQNLKKR